MLIGGFVSASGGIDQAIKRADAEGFEVAMFFIGSPHGWNLPHLTPEQAKSIIESQKQSIVTKTYAHALYLANLGTPDQELYKKSIQALTTTMRNGELFGLEGLIFHLGSHKNTSTAQGLQRVASGIQEVLEKSPGKTKLILENAVQQGDKLGVNFEELNIVIELVSEVYRNRVRVCFDTCHGFSEGYNYSDIKSFHHFLEDIEATIGVDTIDCFHINDSQHELGSHKDRHANYGEGLIGMEGFTRILNEPSFLNKPFIMEIPGSEGNGPTKNDLDILYSLRK